MRLPTPRGPITALLFDHLTRLPHPLDPLPPYSGDPVLGDEDLQLALFACYELHYQGFDGVDDRWEWNPALLAVREMPGRPVGARPGAGRTAPALHATRADAPGPGRSGAPPTTDRPWRGSSRRRPTSEQFREFVMHRSIYHLKEADPHTWAIPRLRGSAKAALVEIQADEYGGGRVERMHSELFRATMRGLDLDDSYGAYLDRVPAITLAISNVMSLFGLHRRHRGALLGHLAAFEMTSSLPNRRYGQGLRRLGGDEAAARFYDEHVQADAVHEQIAAHDMCGGFDGRAAVAGRGHPVRRRLLPWPLTGSSPSTSWVAGGRRPRPCGRWAS